MKLKSCNFQEEGDREKYWPQYLAVLISCLSSMNNGLLTAWSSPFIVKISHDNVTYNISESEASYFATIPTITMMAFCVVSATLCDKIGRRLTLLMTTVPAITSWTIKAFAKDVRLFYLARVFSGIDSGCFYVALPMYIGEISSPKIRGILGSFITSFFYIGQFFINVLGNFFSVRTTSFICVPVPILFFIMFYFMPESPYFYIMKNEDEKAKQALWRLRRKKNIDADFLQLKSDVLRQISESGTWKDMVVIPSNRTAFLVGVFLRAAQFMSGVSVLMTSVQFIFEKSDGILPPSSTVMIYSFLAFSFFLSSACVMDKLGRRIAFILSLILANIVMTLVSIYFYIYEYRPEIDISSFGWVPLVGLIFYVMFAALGFGTVPTLIGSEIFSASIKAKGNIIMAFTAASMASITVLIFFALYPLAGLSGTFLLFIILNCISLIVGYFYIPETKGKTLEEIQQMLKGNSITK